MEAASHPEVNQLDATRLSGEVRTILKGRVAEGTKYNYICANTHSLLWLYNQGEPIRSTLIAPWFVEMLNTKASLDASARKKREEMKKVCREKLGEVSSDLGNCPILLPNLTFEIFTNFLVSKKRSNYHTNRGEDESTVAERQGGGRDVAGVYLSKAAYETARSALVYLHKESGYELQRDFSKRLSDFMGGMKRAVTRDKQRNGLSLVEGKRKMSFQVYEKLC